MTALSSIIQRDTHANRPAFGTAGRLYYETDTTTLFRDSGTAWESVEGAGGGGSGTVTSVALTVPGILSVSGSPVTTSGTLAVTLATETANQILAGPTSGGAATPAFRALVAADLPGDTGFTAPTFSNSWINFGAPYASAGYMKDAQGFVHLRGAVKNGSSLTAAIFTLPSGYRPSAQVGFAVVGDPGVVEVDVTSAGVVAVTGQLAGTDLTTFVGLDGIVFSTL